MSDHDSDDAHMALIRAGNHIDSARWELKRVHPLMDAEEPCLFYEVWTALGEVKRLLNPGDSNQESGSNDA